MKEVNSYKGEAEKQREHVAKMRANNADPYDVKKQVSAEEKKKNGMEQGGDSLKLN